MSRPKNQKILDELVNAVSTYDMEKVKYFSELAIETKVPAYTAVMEGLSNGLDIISERYSKGDAFLSDLIMAGAAMEAGMEVLEPFLKVSEIESKGKIVLGTVYGDMHDLGKNLVGMILRSAGFNVVDLGVDVLPEKFVEEIEKNGADILALSSLVTTTMPYMKDTVKALEVNGLRDKVIVIIGGAPVSAEFAEEIGADAYGVDAVSALNICKKLISQKKNKEL